ncbi:MAG: hypothetical protein ACJA1Z_001253 [Patiriisocius sp.]|jgi:hypothetical protein
MKKYKAPYGIIIVTPKRGGKLKLNQFHHL